MSVTSSISQAGPVSSAGLVPVPSAEVDASCRIPLVVLFGTALKWLVAASLFGVLAAVKLVSPAFLAECPWLTYGRIQPAFTNSFFYGFAIPAGLGVSLWLLARLGKTTLAHRGLAAVGGLCWHLGVLLGVLGILSGRSTGFEMLEMPLPAAALLFGSYIVIAFSGVMTIHERRVDRLYVSQWFLLAALFWFPWIYSTATLLLNVFPVRGVVQNVVDWWFINNFTVVWMALVGLGAHFYFEPKLRNRPLFSTQLAWLAFIVLVLFGSWGGIPAGAPVPAWIKAVSAGGRILTLVTLISVVYNTKMTCGGRASDWLQDHTLRFLFVGCGAFTIGWLLHVLNAIPAFRVTTEYTTFGTGIQYLLSYGFFTSVMFGAIYYIAPKVIQVDWPKPGWINLHVSLMVPGLLVTVIVLVVGGYSQGHQLADPTIPFIATLRDYKGLVAGQVALAIGHLVILTHFCLLLSKCPCLSQCSCLDWIRFKGVGR